MESRKSRVGKNYFLINHSNYYLRYFSARLIISGKPKEKREFKKKGNRIGHFLDGIKFKKMILSFF